MKDRIIAAVEVGVVVLILAAVMPRAGKKKAAEALATPAVEAVHAAFIPTVAPAAPAAPAAAPPPAAEAPAAAAAVKQYWGVVDAVDARTMTLALKDKRGRMFSFKLSPETAVTLGGENKKLTLSDLKAGDNVWLTSDGGPALEVHVRLLFGESGAVARAGDAKA